MERVSEALQLSIIIKWGWASLLESQASEKDDFLFSRIAAEGSILKEFREAGFWVEGGLRFLFHKLEFLRVPRGHSPV